VGPRIIPPGWNLADRTAGGAVASDKIPEGRSIDVPETVHETLVPYDQTQNYQQI